MYDNIIIIVSNIRKKNHDVAKLPMQDAVLLK